MQQSYFWVLFKFNEFKSIIESMITINSAPIRSGPSSSQTVWKWILWPALNLKDRPEPDPSHEVLRKFGNRVIISFEFHEFSRNFRSKTSKIYLSTGNASGNPLHIPHLVEMINSKSVRIPVGCRFHAIFIVFSSYFIEIWRFLTWNVPNFDKPITFECFTKYGLTINICSINNLI